MELLEKRKNMDHNYRMETIQQKDLKVVGHLELKKQKQNFKKGGKVK